MDPKYSGIAWTGTHLLDLKNIDLSKINLADIGRGLSRNYRFGGHTRDDLPPYSVAWHSLFCEAVADQMKLPPWARLQALLHDAPEYILGDMISPIKVLDPIYQSLESSLWEAVAVAFGIPVTWHPAIKEIDFIAFEVERLHLIAPDAWDPAPVVPPEWADLGKKWIEFTHTRNPEYVLASAMFQSRAKALIDAVACEGVDY